MEPTFLQTYWWIIISILGGVLVFLLFVQGGQTLAFGTKDKEYRSLMITSLGRKWELTFTTLVVFGGAFFAAFPLFYSTSFGGAYWLWMLILFSFVVQAVSYEFRTRRGNLYTSHTYDAFLVFNGVFGCILLGVAVGVMFFGGHFVVEKTNILDTASPVISRWADSHGIEAIFNWKCLLLGFTVFFLGRTLGALYFINNIREDKNYGAIIRNKVLINGTVFALLFVSFVIVLLCVSGLREVSDGIFELEENLYLHNLLTMWWLIPVLLVAVVAVLFGIYRTAFSSTFTKGIWFAGAGTIVVVIILFLLAGLNNTAYYPSLLDSSSSLTISNSSSSPFTLNVMAWVSLVVPVVIGYIAYVWRKMNERPITTKDLEDEH